MNKITVFLCDDHALFRECLRLLLQAADNIEIVGEAANGHEAVAEVTRLSPDVVLMDLSMPLLNGIEATRRITFEAPSVRVIVLSGYSDDHRVRQALDAGAAGYVMKESASQELLCAIHDARNENAFFSPPITESLMQEWKNRENRPGVRNARTLTNRQNDVVQLIAERCSTKQIATLLRISASTVEKHRQALMKKLKIHEVATLTRYAVAQGIVEAESYNYPTGNAVVRDDGRYAYRLAADSPIQL
jgi:DNA-binding NarL/FixJ family response regulator